MGLSQGAGLLSCDKLHYVADLGALGRLSDDSGLRETSIHRETVNHESILIKCRFAESDGDVEVTPAPVKTFARMKEKVDRAIELTF